VVEWLESCQIITWLPCSRSLCMVMSVLSLGMGALVGALMAPGLARGPYASLGRVGSKPRGSEAPVLTLQGSNEVEIVLDGVQGSGALMTSCGLRQGKNQP
jgi:hypothetical protein